MRKNKLILFLRIIGFLSFYIVLFFVIILKAFFNCFENYSWLLILSPILFSIGITFLLFLFYFFVGLTEKLIKKENKNV